MSNKKKDEILVDHNHDGIDRRGFLKCMAWVGTGVLFVTGGRPARPSPSSLRVRAHSRGRWRTQGALSFVQISDSHIGFSKEANKDVVGTLQAAIDRINALPTPPRFHPAHGRSQPSVEGG